MTDKTASLSTEIAVRTSTDMIALSDLANAIRSNKRIEVVDDPEQMSREIFEQILGAESNEELNQLGQATGWRDLEGKTVKLGANFRWRPSSYEEGAPYFLIVPVELVLPDGRLERKTLTTGSLNVLAQLMNMAARNTYAGTLVRLKRAEKPSSRGYYPLWLEVITPSDTAAADSEGAS